MPPDEKILDVILKFAADAPSAQQMRKALTALEQELVGLKKEAQATQAAIDSFAKSGKDTSALERRLKTVKDAMVAVEKEAKPMREGLAQAVGEINKSRESLDRLAQIGTTLSITGAAMLAPFLLSANKYVQAAGQADSVSARWQNSMKSIENSQLRLGRAAADVLNPALEQMAKYAEQAMSALDKNPRALQLILGAGGALAGLGGATSALSQFGKVSKTLEGLAAGGGATGALAQATITASNVALAAGAVYLGAEVGNQIGNWVNEKLGLEKQEGPVKAIQTLTTNTLVAIGSKIAEWAGWSAEEIAKRNTEMINKYNPTQSQQGGSTAPVIDNRALFAQTNLQLFSDYKKNLLRLDEQNEKQRASIVDQYGKQRTALEQRYEQDIARSITQFAQSERDAESDYYRSRSELSKSYSQEVQRAEEDHQRRMRQLAAEHDGRMEDLAAGRDALGLVREQRSYEKQRQGEEDSYSQEARRRSEDYANQVAQLEANFRIQRERRQRDFSQSLREREQQHAEEMRLLEQNKNDQLNKLQQSYNEQVEVLRTALLDRIREIDATVLDDYAAFQKKMVGMATEFRNFLNSSGAPAPTTGRAAGGYAGFGKYTLGERGDEFVLNAGTTRSAERLVGGKLSQERMLAAMLGGRRSSAAVGGGSHSMSIQLQGATLSQVRGVIAENNAALAGSIMQQMEYLLG